MGLLNLFSKGSPALLRLPSGSFTFDREGKVLIGTLPSSFPSELVKDIAQQVLAAFRDADAAQLPISEVVMNYATLRITARELRGGAIVFLAPRTAYAPDKSA
jgi:hypothetical protein